jgi:polar amino acid transport system substrate-binding protein
MKKSLLSVVAIFSIVLQLSSFANAGPVFNGILKRGELIVGITGEQPPLNATTKDGEIIGFDADLARAIAKGMNLNIRFSRMPFSELLPALQEGKVDIVVSGVTMTPERNTKVAFGGPYFISGKGILLKIKSMDLLKKEGLNSDKLRVSTLKSSTSQKVVEVLAPNANLTLTDNYDQAIELLLNDKIDAVIADYPFCAYMAVRFADKELAVGETKLTVEPLGIAMPEDTLFINVVENSLKALNLTGVMTDLKEKWFESSAWFDQLPE